MAKLYLVAIHIGDPDDITLRALKVLKNTPTLICEDYKIGRQIMRQYDLGEKELLRLNEHSQEEDVTELLEDYLLKGKDLALFSDTGTPVFADPGYQLLKRAYNYNIDVIPVPGASSLMSALVKSDIPSKRFFFYGFLSAKKEERLEELHKLKSFQDTLIFLEAPYRLKALLEGLLAGLGPHRYMNVLCELTLPGERLIKGTIQAVKKHFDQNPFKGEFVIIISGASHSSDQNIRKKQHKKYKKR